MATHELPGELQEREANRIKKQDKKRKLVFAPRQPPDVAALGHDASTVESSGTKRPRILELEQLRKRLEDEPIDLDLSGSEQSSEGEGMIDEEDDLSNAEQSSQPPSSDVSDVPPGIPVSGNVPATDDGRVVAEMLQSEGIMLLPAHKVFSIQVGCQLYQLSGASISSDAPSYFSRFFLGEIEHGGTMESIRTLYLDRDPETFREISLHLQGYHVEPEDTRHYIRLLADAQFYGLTRLLEILHCTYIFTSVGGKEFKIPQALLESAGNTPNYFTVMSRIFRGQDGVPFPGLDESRLLRPPAMIASSVPDRCPRIFEDILFMLKGYDVTIRDENHRAALLKDARHYHFRALERGLVLHHTAYAPQREREDIFMRLADVRTRGIGYRALRLRDDMTCRLTVQAEDDGHASTRPDAGEDAFLVTYDMSAPLGQQINSEIRDLVLQLDSDDVFLDPQRLDVGFRVSTGDATRQRCDALVDTVIKSITRSKGLDRRHMAQDFGRAWFDVNAHVVLDGKVVCYDDLKLNGTIDLTQPWPSQPPGRLRDSQDERSGSSVWRVMKSQWRLVLRLPHSAHGKPLVFSVDWVAVKIEAFSSEAKWHAQRPFL